MRVPIEASMVAERRREEARRASWARPPGEGAVGVGALLALAVVLALIGWASVRLVGDPSDRAPGGLTTRVIQSEDPADGLASTAISTADGERRSRFPSDVMIDLGTGRIRRMPRPILDEVDAYRPAEYAVSPDGSTLAFVTGDEHGTPHVSLAGLDGSGLRRLSEPAAAAPAWSPDGSRIVVVGHDGTSIDVVRVADGAVRTLAQGRAVWEPSFAPDGRSILYTAAEGGRRSVLSLWSVPVRGGPPTRVHGRAAFGAYSPDGSAIAYHYAGRAVAPSIWPFDFAISRIGGEGTGPPRQLGHNAAGCCHMVPYEWDWTRPEWSPDGTTIAYQRFGTMPGGIDVIDVATRDTVSLGQGALPTWAGDDTLIVERFDPSTSELDPWNRVELGSADAVYRLRTKIARALPEPIVSMTAIEPDYAPSPDGARIAFVGRRHDWTRAVFVADFDGRHRRRLSPDVPFTSLRMSPAWSPDGRRLTYVSTARSSGTQHVYLVDLATGERRSLVVAHGSEPRLFAPAFAPDGGSVIYTRRGSEHRRETLDLWTVPVSGGPAEILIRHAAFGAYSPDGSTIAFRRASSAFRQDLPGGTPTFPLSLGVLLADGEGRPAGSLGPAGGSVMAPLLAWPSVPRWSPDGTRIAAFVMGRGQLLFDVGSGRAERIGRAGALAWIDDDTLIAEEASG